MLDWNHKTILVLLVPQGTYVAMTTITKMMVMTTVSKIVKNVDLVDGYVALSEKALGALKCKDT